MPQSGLYDYTTPAGYGDTFFQYVYDADSLTDGNNYFQQGIRVTDGLFIPRYWGGLESVVAASGSIQIYDWLKRQLFASPIIQNTMIGASGKAILPEIAYPPDGDIRMDLANVLRSTPGGGFYRSQIVFTGVRRRQGFISDPQPSNYKYYEKPYQIPYSLSINAYATGSPAATVTIPVQDFDFELRRVELTLQSAQQLSQFKVVMYDNNWIQLSNLPVMANRFFHLDPSKSSGEMNFNPSPPILYKIDSVIRFDVYSLLISPTVLPQTFNLLFDGVRRIPC